MNTKPTIMTRITALIFLLSFSMQLQAQTGFRHQGLLRDDGDLVANQNIAVQYLIRKDNPSGLMVYSETANLITDDYGIFTHSVGSLDSDAFNSIDWSDDVYFLEVIVNGTNMGTTEITKVPLAYYADKVRGLENHQLSSLADVSSNVPVGGDALVFRDTTWLPEKLQLPIAWGWIQTGTLAFEGYGIQSITSPGTGEYVITLDKPVSGYPCIVATAFTRTGAAEITGYSADPSSNIITIKIFDDANPGALKSSDFSFIVFDN